MAELEHKNEMMIQLPWAVPQQPLVTTQIQIDPQTQKIPIDITVSSTDTTAIWITGLSFIVTAFIVYMSTRQQIKANEDLINNQMNLMKSKNIFDQSHEDWNQIVKICTDTLSIQNKIILEIYKTFQNPHEMMNIDSSLLDEYQRELLNLFHFLMLILDESESNFQKIKSLENIFIHVTRSAVIQISTQNTYLDGDTKERILKNIAEKNIFDEQEINNLNNFELNNYQILTNLNVILQKEFRKLLKQKKAA